jgi:predicted nuclease of predicted toxin-antitoxin system
MTDDEPPPATAVELGARGHDAVAVADVAMLSAPDADVVDWAVTEPRVVVTENFADFAALVAQRQGDEPSTPVVFVRKSAFPAGRALASHLASHLDKWADRNPDPYQGLHWP